MRSEIHQELEKSISLFPAFGTLGGYLRLLNQTKVKLLLVQKREHQLAKAVERKSNCSTIALGELKRRWRAGA